MIEHLSLDLTAAVLIFSTSTEPQKRWPFMCRVDQAWRSSDMYDDNSSVTEPYPLPGTVAE